MAEQRTYTGGRFALDIGTGADANVGFLKKFEGLAMEADIVANDLGPDNVQKKHVANVKWTPAKASIGIGMGKAMYEWMKAAFDKGYVTKSGTFTSADFNYKAMSELTFKGALITGVTAPKLDGASKDAAYFDIEFEVEEVRWAKGSGQDIRGKIGPKQKQWLCSNFRVEVGDLPCTRVATVDSFTWKCAVAPDMLGCFVENTKHPAKVTVPDLKLAISYADHQIWAERAKRWFIDGFRTEDDEVGGAIVYLGPDMKKELGRITLDRVGFKKFADDTSEANSEKIKRFNVELYVEKMTFQIAEYDA